jgi:hypothetical protein
MNIESENPNFPVSWDPHRRFKPDPPKSKFGLFLVCLLIGFIAGVVGCIAFGVEAFLPVGVVSTFVVWVSLAKEEK